jgi:pyruvate kinase
LLLDLQGPKIRLSAQTLERVYAEGETVIFSSIEEEGVLQVVFSDFAGLCSPDSQIVIGDGALRFHVIENERGRVQAVATSAGSLGPGKGINVTHAQPLLPALTEKDLHDIELAVEVKADFVALSFVRSRDDVSALRKLLEEAGSRARVIAKIEKVEAVTHLDAIITVSHGLMVARGDYGVEAGVAHVPHMQKTVIHQAAQLGLLVVTATQMLESMIVASEPTRAEVLDVYNAVLDGTSAVMLSAETSVGAFPVQAVKMMADVVELAERSEDIYCATHGATAESKDSAVMHAAVALARDTNAVALIVPTATGGSARACAKYRPRRPVIALCHEAVIANQLALEWGVYPSFMALTETADELVAEAMRAAMALGLEELAPGGTVVVTAGPSVGQTGATNIIALQTL